MPLSNIYILKKNIGVNIWVSDRFKAYKFAFNTKQKIYEFISSIEINIGVLLIPMLELNHTFHWAILAIRLNGWDQI